jgi:hypothetical protein
VHGKRTYKNDIKRLSLRNPSFEGIDSKTSILGNFDGMSILLEDLDGKFLVDKIIFSQKDIEGDVIGS